MQNLVYDWVDFFKIWPNLSQNWLKFKKILEKIGNFVQNLAQNWVDWFMNGLRFLEKVVFVWVYFQIPWRHIRTKTKLEYPLGNRIMYLLLYCLYYMYSGIYSHFQRLSKNYNLWANAFGVCMTYKGGK